VKMRTLVRGLAAGLVGTAFMTAWQELAAALKRHGPMNVEERHAEDPDPWKKAPAPAQVAKRAIEAVSGIEVPASRIGLFTNAVHWGYGTTMGVAYALGQSASRGRAAVRGPLFGTGVWASSYAMLVPMGLYEWPWRYPAKTIAKDVSYHLVYGTGVAAGYSLLSRGR
jgi:hypothetical protein